MNRFIKTRVNKWNCTHLKKSKATAQQSVPATFKKLMATAQRSVPATFLISPIVPRLACIFWRLGKLPW